MENDDFFISFAALCALSLIHISIGEERETIEDVLEPYLIQQGFLQRTPRGRMATDVYKRQVYDRWQIQKREDCCGIAGTAPISGSVLRKSSHRVDVYKRQGVYCKWLFSSATCAWRIAVFTIASEAA